MLLLQIEKQFGRFVKTEYVMPSIRFYEQVADFINERFKGTHHFRVLDVGCSYGYGLYIMERKCRQKCEACDFVGVDINEQAILTAEKIVRSTNVRFETADLLDDEQVQNISNKYGLFDIVTCFEVFEHMAPTQGEVMLKNLHKLLKKGGFLFISTPNKEVYDIFAFTEEHTNEVEYEKFVESIQKYFKVVLVSGSRAYSRSLIKVFWKFGLVARKGDTKIRLSLWRKLFRKLLILLLAPHHAYLQILRRYRRVAFLLSLYSASKLNCFPRTSSLVLVTAQKEEMWNSEAEGQ